MEPLPEPGPACCWPDDHRVAVDVAEAVDGSAARRVGCQEVENIVEAAVAAMAVDQP